MIFLKFPSHKIFRQIVRDQLGHIVLGGKIFPSSGNAKCCGRKIFTFVKEHSEGGGGKNNIADLIFGYPIPLLHLLRKENLKLSWEFFFFRGGKRAEVGILLVQAEKRPEADILFFRG